MSWLSVGLRKLTGTINGAGKDVGVAAKGAVSEVGGNFVKSFLSRLGASDTGQTAGKAVQRAYLENLWSQYGPWILIGGTALFVFLGMRLFRR